MYVVRLTIEGEVDDYKATTRRHDAENRFWAGWSEIADYEGATAGLYEVPGIEDAREAVAAVRNHDATVLLLEARPTKLKISLDLSSLTLKNSRGT